MKRLLFLVSILVGMAVASSAQMMATPAADIMNAAYKKAAKENKNVFLLFHASWCGWCHKMDTSMNDESCRQFFTDNYVIVHLVVSEGEKKKHLENPGAEEMKTQYNGKDQGIPFWLVFDKDGKLLADSKIRKEGEGAEAGENTGCPAQDFEVEYFISVLRKTSNLSLKQEDAIRERFSKNKL
jgi:thioredoxin-related protein